MREICLILSCSRHSCSFFGASTTIDRKQYDRLGQGISQLAKVASHWNTPKYFCRFTAVVITLAVQTFNFPKIFIAFPRWFLKINSEAVEDYREGSMPLREHPLFRHHNIPSWPPVWTWTGGVENDRPQGEIGILRKVEASNIQPTDRCFLHVDHEGSW